MSTDAPAAIFSRKRKRTKFELKAEELSEEDSSDLTTMTLQRLLAAEGSLTEGGASRSRTALIARFVSQQSLYGELSPDTLDPVTQALVDFLLVDFKDKLELAMVWLFHERAMEADKAEGRYEVCVTSLLKGLQDSLTDKHRVLFRRVVLECPRITPAVVCLVRDFCLVPEQASVGLATLRDSIVLRPPARDSCLPVLLNYAHRGRPEVSIWAQIYFTHDFLFQTLQRQAILTCKKLAQVFTP